MKRSRFTEDQIIGILKEHEAGYLDTLRWVLIAIALIGIAVTIHARLKDWKRGQR